MGIWLVFDSIIFKCQIYCSNSWLMDMMSDKLPFYCNMRLFKSRPRHLSWKKMDWKTNGSYRFRAGISDSVSQIWKIQYWIIFFPLEIIQIFLWFSSLFRSYDKLLLGREWKKWRRKKWIYSSDFMMLYSLHNNTEWIVKTQIWL